MKKYDLTPEQTQRLEQAFLEAPPADGTMEKVQKLNQIYQRAAREIFQLTPVGEEQSQLLTHLRSSHLWAVDAVRKHEH